MIHNEKNVVIIPINCFLSIRQELKVNISNENIQKIGEWMRNKNLIDTRNCLDHNNWMSAGFDVKVLGNGIK